jgi:glycosyltransferase involved in cell wall biosynthesis
MKISAYTYVRNGLKMGYPFIESIKSILHIVHEYVIVLGDSDDGSREAILNLNSHKIKIVDTVWDMNFRVGGKLFAQQSNIGLDHVDGDWIVHLQADEVIHENNIEKLINAINAYDNVPKVEGLLFPFLNFRGDYHHIHTGRKSHRFEIRAFRRNKLIRAYKDSQGFRKFSSIDAYNQGEKGKRLRVVKIDVPVFHYSYVRPPKLMIQKSKFFLRFYRDDEGVDKVFRNLEEIDYSQVDKLSIFTGTHPKVMAEMISRKDWDFVYDPSKCNSSLRHKILNKIEDLTGYRIGEYKNYKIVK